MERSEPVDDMVYHYTTAEGLKGIIESRCLWATNVNFLNDVSEYNHGMQILKERFADLETYRASCCIPENFIEAIIRALGRVPIIDINPPREAELKVELQAEAKRQKLLNFDYPEDMPYRERTTVERVDARLKDERGERSVRVRGNAKVRCHLIGIVRLAADQILRLIT